MLMLRKLFFVVLAALVCLALAQESASPSPSTSVVPVVPSSSPSPSSPSPSTSEVPAASASPSPSHAVVPPSPSPSHSAAPVANVTVSPSPSASSSPAVPSPSNSTAPNATATPSPKPKFVCANYTGCGNCTEQWDCVWCDSDRKCVEGNVWGPNENPFNGCADWRWRQCKANGKAIFWASVSITAAGLLLFLFCCFCCCCYCRKRRRLRHIVDRQKSWSQIKAEEAEMDRLLGTRTPKTDTRREQIYAKYGRPGERSVNSGAARGSIFSQ